MQLRNRLKELRARDGLNQTELARLPVFPGRQSALLREANIPHRL